MNRVRKQISAVGAFLGVAAIAVSMLSSVVHAEPSPLQWQDITPAGWSDVVEFEGPMIWGRIYDTAAFNGGLWAAGRNTAGDGTLWRYDTTSGNWANVEPSGLDAGANYAYSSLFVLDNKLYLGTDNDDGSQIWYLNGSTWQRDTAFDTANTGIQTIEDLSNQGIGLCVIGRSTHVQLYCKSSGNWNSYNLGSTNASYEGWGGSYIVEAGSSLYINAMTEDTFAGIWKFSSGTWTQVETPFTDEEETNEETAWTVLDMIKGPNDRLTTIVHDGSGVEQVWSYNGSTWTQLGLNNFGHPDDGSYNYGKLTMYKGNLFAGIGAYNQSPEVYEWNGASWSLRNADYFGAAINDNGFNPNYVRSMTVIGDELFIATAAEGEGSYFPQIWRTPPFVGGDDEDEGDDTPAPNVDEDNISDAVEAAAPNGGDANGDGVLDKNQPNVTSFVNTVTNKYAVLQSDCTGNSSVSVANAGGLSVKDGAFSYPAGLMNFTLACSTPGMTANVSMYYYGDYNAATVVARKYNSVKKEYATISGANVTNVTIGGQKAVKIAYAIKDGGELDQDGVANGTIVDPAGPGVNSVSAPNTGAGGSAAKFWLLNL